MLSVNNVSVSKQNNRQNKIIYFSKVIIHGRITNFAIKEFKSGKKSVKLSISTSDDASMTETHSDYVDHEIDVYVEKKHALKTSKHWLIIGKNVVLDGKIALLFIRSNDKLVKRVQYISIENILFSRNDALKETDENYIK